MIHKTLKVLFIFILGLIILNPVQAQDLLSYENKAMGVKLNGPKDWYVVSGDKIKENISEFSEDFTSLKSIRENIKKVGILVVFCKYPFGYPVEFNPNITLTTQEIPTGVKFNSLIEIANASILTLRTMYKDVRIIKEPTIVNINNNEGVHFIWEGTSVVGYLEIRLRSSAYIFIKNNVIYTLNFTDKAVDFDNNVKAFDFSVDSFILN